MKEKIAKLIIDFRNETLPDQVKLTNDLLALFASELATYKELCEAYKKFIELMDDASKLQQIHDIIGVKELLLKGRKFRQRITELETKIKEL